MFADYTPVAQQASDPYHARYYPAVFAELEQALSEEGDLSKETLDGIYTNARLAITFDLSEDDYSAKGNTRFYGLPDLPPGIVYPKIKESDSLMRANSGKKSGPREYLTKFVAQINLADMKDLQDYLPKSGFLYFFIDSQYYASRCMNYPYHIFYYAGDADSLQSAKDLPIDMVDIFDIDQGFETEGGAKPAKATARAVISILHNTYPEEYEAEDGEDEDSDPYQYNTNLSFDYPPPIIDAPESLLERFVVNENAMNAQFGYEGNYDGSPYIRAAQLFGGHPGDYIMLLQTAGNPDINHFMYEDGDAMYFMIAKDKLKNLDFSEVYVGNTWWWRDGPGEEPQYWDKKLLKKQIKECLK